MWAVDPRDWQRPGSQVVANRLVAGARPGRILLAHDIHAPTITAMPQTFDRLLAKGFQFVTVSQLIASDEKNNPQLAEAGKNKEGEVDPKAIAGAGSPDTVGPVDLTAADISEDAKAITLSDIEAWEKLHGLGKVGGASGKGEKPQLYKPIPLKPLPSEGKKEKPGVNLEQGGAEKPEASGDGGSSRHTQNCAELK